MIEHTKATQTDMFNEPSDSSSASSNRSAITAIEGSEDRKQERQVSLSSGESMGDVRYRTRMSIADNLASLARVGGNIIYYTGKGIGQGINMAADAYDRMNEDEEDEDPEAPINQEVFENTQRIIRRGASRSRSSSRQEQASSSNQAMKLLRRGASRSRSPSPPKRSPKK